MKKKLQNKVIVRNSLKYFSLLCALLFCLSVVNGYTNTPNMSIQQQVKNKKITFKAEKSSLKEILYSLQKQSGLSFIYKDDKGISLIRGLNIDLKDVTVEYALNIILLNTGYEYKLINDGITIYKGQTVASDNKIKPISIKGKVISDETSLPIVGATILIKGTSKGAISNSTGEFILNTEIGSTIEITFMGMKPYTKVISDKDVNLIIELEKDELAVEDVIVTGIFNRNKDSFTGSVSTYNNKQIKQAGGANILQSLRTIDPSFIMVDSKQYGNDPNRLPQVEMRGVTSISTFDSEFSNDPNRPLFVLDGMETSIEEVVRINVDRVQSITLLKDASATAIYGSRAANGVVVIETITPTKGKIKLSYNGSFAFQIPDMSDYNLMNSAEKLEFEVLAGLYEGDGSFSSDLYYDRLYNEKKKEILRGVDTDWLSFPLRIALNQGHNVYVDGGDDHIRYMLGLSYNNNDGVMKKSNNETIGANFTLSYRTKKILFTNKFSTSINTSEREPVQFSEFSKQNPFFRPYQEDGSLNKYLYEQSGAGPRDIINPLYLYDMINDDATKSSNFTNSFMAEYRLNDNLRLTGRIGLTYKTTNLAKFTSPNLPQYDKVVDGNKKGSYQYNAASDFSYDGRVSIVYGKLFKDKHLLNIIGNWDFNEVTNSTNGYTVHGFVSDDHKNPQFSSGFSEGAKPKYSKGVSRSTSFLTSLNYAYDNKYLLDATYRADGTSRFGSENLFVNTYSLGVAWNIHSEQFLKDVYWVDILKIRGSIGNPGNQNFDPYISYKTYLYNIEYQNMFGPSALISNQGGNTNLEWQKTIDKNIGVDISLLNSRFRVAFNYFIKTTDPQIVSLTLPISSGATTAFANLGGLKTVGYDCSINGTILRKNNIIWNMSLNFSSNKRTYFGIGNSLDNENNSSQNDFINDGEESTKKLLSTIKDTDLFKRYYDGSDIDDLYVVRSAGIDPATGHELFYDKYGNLTFKYDATDEVKLGNSRPAFEGVIGSNLTYKGFTVSVYFRCKIGADIMASALYQKIENITNTDVEFNLDKRALYDRWQKPGDEAKFTAANNFGQFTSTPMSSRFLVEENTISMESLSVGYEMNSEVMDRYGIAGMNFMVNMNNLFHISSFKEERGLDYPFSRTISLSIGIRF